MQYKPGQTGDSDERVDLELTVSTWDPGSQVSHLLLSRQDSSLFQLSSISRISSDDLPCHVRSGQSKSGISLQLYPPPPHHISHIAFLKSRHDIIMKICFQLHRSKVERTHTKLSYYYSYNTGYLDCYSPPPPLPRSYQVIDSEGG